MNTYTPPKLDTDLSVFEYVREELLKQPAKSVGPEKPDEPYYEPPCKYRGASWQRCAVGHLIADDQYGDWLEGYLPGDAEDADPLFDAIRSSIGHEPSAQLLVALQHVHDSHFETRADLLEPGKWTFATDGTFVSTTTYPDGEEDQ